MSRPLLALLLICVCATASAREVRKLAANDAGDCPEVAAAKAEAEDKQSNAPARANAKTPAPPLSKPTTVRGADQPGASRLQAPRWHSFLPGMFR